LLEEMSCEASDNIDISSNIEAEGIEDAENEIISQASTTDSLEEFDFSREDPIDKYDSYTKKPLNGIEYVYIGKLNSYNSKYSWTPDDFRYGGYIRSSETYHNYMFTNADYGGKLSSNVLTVYADKGVKFQVTNALGELVVDSEKGHVPAKVSYYNVETVNGHNIYYVELKPASVSENNYMIQLSKKDSASTLHYSLWYGNPVMKSATAPFNELIELVTKRPYTSSSKYGTLSPYMPKKAWIRSVNVKKDSEMSRGYLLDGYITLFAPGMSSNSQAYNISEKEVVFDFEVSSASAYEAYGNYDMQHIRLKWNPNFDVPDTYHCSYVLTFNYVYAIGA